ncbi:ribosome silencing factor [Aerococcus suis]|uniref:Ribosomal silencing factor RsfS n=1 Tax=Aerococcus suis TaxID=371602 RepID=A0A1W1YKL4_9LACT|nr:ribosome silencing factor [Aerococcus suis]MCI7240356.1 ribosome silencing factor [Aerococcus suis]MDD7759010.1 ribosome silencing factor [Aerococcus suis]SMC36663.1 ribosome-associated protein [Aerococcus suis]
MTEQLNNKLLETIILSADDKLADDIVALDVHELTPLSDYFVVMSGNNERQVQAIVANIEEDVEKAGFDIRGIEGRDGNRWILMDCYDVIVHVFLYSERDYYNLEKMWVDAPLVDLTDWIK